jgi:hypothetical protein
MPQALRLDSLVLKNLDDYHVWPVKHRHWTFDVAEDKKHDLWVRCSDLRNFYEKFPTDKVLKARYRRMMLLDQSTKTLYIPVRLMRAELMKSKPYSFHTDVLKFLDWFERNVLQVIEKKRTNKVFDAKNSQRDELALTVSGPAWPPVTHPRFSETTVPLSPQERWALEREGHDFPRVYHPEARPQRVTWSQHWAELRSHWAGELWSFLLGRKNYALTWFILCFASVLCIFWSSRLLLPDSLDWTVSYHRVGWAFAFLALLGVLCACAYAAVMTCGLVWRWRQGKNVAASTALYIMMIGLAPLFASACFDTDMVDYWYANVTGRYRPMTVYADPHLGRIVASGDMWLGSSEALESVINRYPQYTLLEMESPGGFLVEGIRMARMVKERNMDTVSMDYCISACTLVLSSGGERYLGDKVRVGFHRSGTFSNTQDYGWTSTDYRIAELFRTNGVSKDFIDQALKLPMWELWYAPHPDMYSAGYATHRWFDRKAGY